ncbi:hypothetical protein LEP1GSC127_1703 [Leptospira kirschneri str. 200801925]|nr:hypothetical protein LEP1GSC127_1703 [Leptospira kirschneri str. 200801925]
MIGGMAGEDLYFQGRIYQSVGVKELLEFLKKFSVSKNQKPVSFEYFAYSQEYTEGMKDLKYDSDTKEGMIGHLKQFHSKEISDITSVRIVNKKKLGNIEIFYGIYQEK